MTKLKAIAFAVQELESEVKALPQTASEGWEECDTEWIGWSFPTNGVCQQGKVYRTIQTTAGPDSLQDQIQRSHVKHRLA